MILPISFVEFLEEPLKKKSWKIEKNSADISEGIFKDISDGATGEISKKKNPCRNY